MAMNIPSPMQYLFLLSTSITYSPHVVAMNLTDILLILVARVKVHEKVTNIDGDFKRIFYRVTVVDNFKQSGLNRGKELWIVTDDREGCECLKMRNNRSYLVGLKMQSVRDKTVYHLDETSIVRKWNRGIGLSEALSKCIH